MPKYTGFNHLAMATRDMETTVRFWRDLLGLRLVAGLGRKGYRQYFLELTDTDMIAFYEWNDVEPMPEKDHGVPAKGPFVFDHLAIGVENRADLWELKDKLDAAGFWVSEVIDHGFVLSLYSFDPNNIPIEFCWRQPGIDLGFRPKMVDRDPPACGREGPKPVPGRWPEVATPTPHKDFRIYPGEGRELFGKG